MKTLIKKVFSSRRAILYSTFLVVGFIILINMTTFATSKAIFFGSLILYMILALELSSVWFFARRKLEQFNIPIVDRYDKLTHSILHLILPSLMYWSAISFLFSNINPNFWIFYVVILWVFFFLLFVNLRAYYEDKFRLEQRTHYIYDFIKLLIYFLFSYSIFNLKIEFLLSDYLIGFIFFILTQLILSLNLIRYKEYSQKFIWYTTLWSLLASTVNIILLSSERMTIFQLTLFAFILFYVAVGVLHHKIKRDLTAKLLAEYGVIALLVASMMI